MDHRLPGREEKRDLIHETENPGSELGMKVVRFAGHEGHARRGFQDVQQGLASIIQWIGVNQGRNRMPFADR